MSVNLPEPDQPLLVPGVELATGAAAINSGGRDDIALLRLAPSSSVSGVFTQSGFRAAPVDIAERHIALDGVQALLINSGNANAATGAGGFEDAMALCEAVADSLRLEVEKVAPFSTGVIGERLPLARMLTEVNQLADRLNANNWLAAAAGIMTTDTGPKLVTRTLEIDGHTVTCSGIAKGAGMIRPDMATMLAFVCCDARISKPCLDVMVRDAAEVSFNRITIDGDTSTNDALIFAATGQAGHKLIEEPAAAQALGSVLTELCQSLAQAIVRDGEGASKYVTLRVEGGADASECLQVAYTVAESPLVKTALFASDPNWGRLAMAIGRAGIPDLDQSTVKAWFDSVQVMAAGVKAADYTEAAGAAVLALDEFMIRIDLGRGTAVEEIWTTDLSYEYVRINAEYRT